MIKILFYSVNGVGLGHIVRGVNIAKELRKIIDCDIIFATNSPFTNLFEKENFKFIKGGVDPYEVHAGRIPAGLYHDKNEKFLLNVLKSVDPDIVIFDVLIMSKALEFIKNNNIFSVYILREINKSEYLIKHKESLTRFDLILICGVENFQFIDPAVKKTIPASKIFYINNIFRNPVNKDIENVLLKYKKNHGELLVTITAGGGGGGGCLREVKKFFECVSMINKVIVKKSTELKKIRWVLIKGPLFRYKIKLSDNFEIYEYEENLLELFCISDLVVSTAGYNSINEIIASRTPALVYPLPSLMDSQTSRAFYYSSMGFIRLFNIRDFKKATKLFVDTLNPACLNKMKESYNNYEHKDGKRSASGIILREFFKHLERKTKIGVFRLSIDTTSEFFLKEEMKNLMVYEPLYFCGKIKRLGDNANDYFCQDLFTAKIKNFNLPFFTGKSIEKFHEVVRGENIRLLHSQFLTDTVSYLPLIKYAALPLVVNFRGYELTDPRADLFFSKVQPFMSKIITRSRFQENELINKGIEKNKIEVVYGGINIDKIPFKFRDIEDKKIKFLTVGRFVEKKGFETTLSFFKNFMKNHPLSKLTLITDSGSKNKLKDYTDNLGIGGECIEIKEFMPHAKFIKELYAHDIFILLSKTALNGDREGIPNVLKEAVASGMPAISSYHAGIPELIEDGKTGFLIEEGRFEDVEKKIESILKNRQETLKICLNGRFLVEKKFDIHKTTRSLESLYDNLLAPDYIKKINEVLEGKKPVKFRADLHLISGCNGKCLMCDNWKKPITTDFSKKDILGLLDNLEAFGVDYVRFHGQEPTLRKDLLYIMSRTKEKGFKVGLKTNCLSFNGKKKIKLLSEVVDDLYISMDSHDEKIHNLLRGNKESYKKNLNLIKNLRDFNPSVQVFFNSVITKYNYENIDRILDLAHTLMVNKVSFVHLNKKNKKNIAELILNKAQLKDFYFKIWPKILEKSLKFKIPVTVDPFFESLLGLSLKCQIKELKERSAGFDEELDNFSEGLYGKKFYAKNTCYGILDHVTIDWRGNVYPCCAMPRSPLTAIGNVRQKEFTDIWKSKAYSDYRQQILEGKCRYKDECSRNFKHTKEINAFIKGRRADNHNNKFLDKFLDQFNHNDYLYRYKLKMMFYYAVTKSDFYRAKFKDNPRMDNLDFSKLPLTTRDELKIAFTDGKNIVPNYFEEDYGIFRTSSCGKNAFLYARPLNSSRFPSMAACFLNTGEWKIGQPWLKLTALNCLETTHPLTEKSFSAKKMPPKKESAIIIPPVENFVGVSSPRIIKIYDLIKNSGSKIIHANPSYLKLLLHRFNKEELTLDGRYAVTSTYEVLLPSTKNLIETYLNCRVYDQYGCSEIGPISFRCTYGNNHIFSNSVYAEIIPAEDLGRSDIGRVVVTDLENRVMPFIKYFTGDFAYVKHNKKCLCDLNTPLMGDVMGREEEMIDYKGRIIFPLELDKLFCDIDDILLYQVIFEDSRFFVKLVLKDTTKKIRSDSIKAGFKELFEDKNCQIDIQVVDSMLPNRKGKYRSVIIK